MPAETDTDAAGHGFLIGLLFGAMTVLAWLSGELMLAVPITLVTGLLAIACIIPEERS